MNMKNDLSENGFFTVRGFFTEGEIERYRSLCDNYFKNYKFYRGHGGDIVPGWAGVTPELEEMNFLHEDSRILNVVGEVLGENHKFVQHSDLHKNKTSGWHTDTGDYKRGGGKIPNWDEDFLVIKVSVLLQDHEDNDFGLWVKPKSHRNISSEPPIPIKSARTDLIIFDQKILHRGMNDSTTYKNKYGRDRYLITFGYGLDNENSDTHAKGCVMRQNQQREKMI